MAGDEEATSRAGRPFDHQPSVWQTIIWDQEANKVVGK